MKRRSWLLALLGVGLLHAQVSGTSDFVYLSPRVAPVDGNTWRVMSAEDRWVYLSGLRDGLTFGISGALSVVAPNSGVVYDPLWTNKNEVDVQWPVTLSYTEVAAAIDYFYQKQDYRQLWVGSAMNVVCYQKTGASESEVHTRIKLLLRMTKEARKLRGAK
jgi:hypothetical protein